MAKQVCIPDWSLSGARNIPTAPTAAAMAIVSTIIYICVWHSTIYRGISNQ